MSPIFGDKINISMWGDGFGYWWPLLGIMLLGFLLCIMSRFHPKSTKEELPMQFKDSPFALLWKAIMWGLIIIGGAFLLMLFAVGVYYAFFSKYMPIVLPVCVGVCVVGYLLYIGWKVFKNSK